LLLANYGKDIRATILAPLAALCLALALWSLSLLSINPDTMNDLGLVSVFPPLLYVSLIILTTSFCLALNRGKTLEPVLLLHVLALIVILHATPVIVYGTLRYSWAWKHVGIVDYIQRYHAVDPTISTLNAYHNWPGFFALSAFLTESAGLENPLVIAKWASVFFNVLLLGVLLLIFRTFTSDRRLIWLSVWFFFLANWVGQDYFAPQTLNYFLHLLIVGLCLRWFSIKTPPSAAADRRRDIWGRALSWVHRKVGHYVHNDLPDSGSHPIQRAGLMLVIILIFVVIASSHQLTPFMTIAAVTALVICRRCSSRGLPLLFAVVAVSWLISGAREFFTEEIDSLIESFGRVSDNLNDNLIDLSRVPWGQRVVGLAGRGLSGLVVALAFLGAVRRLRRRYFDLSAMLLALVAFAPLMGTGYGGEVVFRIYLFTVPFMVFFAAALMYPDPESGASRMTAATTILVSLVLFLGFSLAHYGKDKQYHFTQDEIDAATYLYNTAPPGALLIEGSRSYPSQFRNYEFFTYVPIDREPREGQLRMLNNPAEVLLRWMSNDEYTRAYLLITRSQKEGVEARGKMPSGFLESIERAILESPDFRVAYSNQNARIFVLADAANGGGP
jgi:hypothetical protein